MNNIYHFWGTSDGVEMVGVNGDRLEPAPPETGNIWQRYALILLRHEYGQHLPVSPHLLARYLPAGRPIQSDSLPPIYPQPRHVKTNVLMLTSKDLVTAVARAKGVESNLAADDDRYLTELIPGPDYRLAGALMDSGLKPGLKSLAAIVDAYICYNPEISRCRREMLRTLLRGGLDLCADTGGKTLLHHLCAGTAPAQDIGLVLDAGAHEIINWKDETGDTPLLSYCRRQHGPRPNRAGLSLLLDHGADPNIENNGGETAYTLTRDDETLANILL